MCFKFPLRWPLKLIRQQPIKMKCWKGRENIIDILSWQNDYVIKKDYVHGCRFPYFMYAIWRTIHYNKMVCVPLVQRSSQYIRLHCSACISNPYPISFVCTVYYSLECHFMRPKFIQLNNNLHSVSQCIN